jgi:hypothetical protein
LLFVHFAFDPAAGRTLAKAVYAAGVNGDGAAFLLRAPFDFSTGTTGEWQSLAPDGLATPAALYVGDAGFDGNIDIYLADTNTVWISPDEGVTWQEHSTGLNGAQVKAFTTWDNNNGFGVLAATEQGLFVGPAAGNAGDWLATGFPYTTTPVDFQSALPASVLLNGGDYAYRVLFPLLSLSAPSEPTPTETPSPTSTPTATPTATPEPTATPTQTPEPGACQELIVNGGFEERRHWLLPATFFSARYRILQAPIYEGEVSLQTGIPVESGNRFSYSTGYQWIRLPANAGKITFQAQVWRESAAPQDRDLQYVWLMRSIWRVHEVFRGRSNAQAWETVTYDLTPLKGRIVGVLFGTYNNGRQGKTAMYVDNVSIQACP